MSHSTPSAAFFYRIISTVKIAIKDVWKASGDEDVKSLSGPLVHLFSNVKSVPVT
jgi:hypothetical protein